MGMTWPTGEEIFFDVKLESVGRAKNRGINASVNIHFNALVFSGILRC
jgi:hypothetical protein